MDGVTLSLFLAGLVLLVIGAEGLVRGATRLAAGAGVSPLVVGLTVVAFGTSAPEMAVSLQSALSGQADIAYGNVVGSNIFNVLFILGASAAIAPLAVAQQLVRLDVPIMIAVSFLCLGMSLDVRICRLEGSGMVGVPGIASRLFGALAAGGINVILISQASSEHSICFVVDPAVAAKAARRVDAEFAVERRAGVVEPLSRWPSNRTRCSCPGSPCTAWLGSNSAKTPGVRRFAGTRENATLMAQTPSLVASALADSDCRTTSPSRSRRRQ